MCENILKAEGIEIKIEEVNGLKTINIIQAENCNIKFKGNIILENTKEEFSAIPIQIRDQLKGYATTIEEKNGETIFDIDTCANYYCSINTIITDESKAFLKMNNWLMSAEKISENNEQDLDIDKYNKKVQGLINKAKEMELIFEFSHDGDEYDDCYSLYVPVKGFSMDKVKEFLTLWEDYNDEMNELIE
jgi:transcriptional regulator with GAF, ATPase, and Fis domain